MTTDPHVRSLFLIHDKGEYLVFQNEDEVAFGGGRGFYDATDQFITDLLGGSEPERGQVYVLEFSDRTFSGSDAHLELAYTDEANGYYEYYEADGDLPGAVLCDDLITEMGLEEFQFPRDLYIRIRPLKEEPPEQEHIIYLYKHRRSFWWGNEQHQVRAVFTPNVNRLLNHILGKPEHGSWFKVTFHTHAFDGFTLKFVQQGDQTGDYIEASTGREAGFCPIIASQLESDQYPDTFYAKVEPYHA